MLKSVIVAAITLVIAIGGGAASVWYVLQEGKNIGALAIGPWTLDPTTGTPDADPYSKARFAREGQLALGRAEGVVFIASTDSRGQPLHARCSYMIAGTTPISRFWTLFPMVPEVAGSASARRYALHSRSLLHSEDGGVMIAASRRIAPGNWLPLEEGPFQLVLSIYDTPNVGMAELADTSLPRIVREACSD